MASGLYNTCRHRPTFFPSQDSKSSEEKRKAERLAARESDGQAEKAQESLVPEEVIAGSNEDNDDTADVTATVYNCEICDFVRKKESGLNIHMSKKHLLIEQLDGNVELNESDGEESDEYDIAKDPNYELRTYLSYAECECCTFSPVSCGRKVSTAWISKDTPRWKNQILPFKPGYFLE